MTPDPVRFTVTRLPAVDRQIEDLVSTTPRGSQRKNLLAILRTVVDRLQTDPLRFGDPIYRTKKDAGKVCHGYLAPVSVHFVVYETEQVVCMLKVRKRPGRLLG